MGAARTDEKDRSRRDASGRSARSQNPRTQDRGRRRPTRRPSPNSPSARRSSGERVRPEDRRRSTARRAAGTQGASRPSMRRDVYVGARPKTIDPCILVVAAVALVAVVLFVFARCSGAAGQAGQPADGASAPAQQNDVSSTEPVTFTISFAGDCTLGTDEYFDKSTSFNARYDEEGDPAYFFRNVRYLAVSLGDIIDPVNKRTHLSRECGYDALYALDDGWNDRSDQQDNNAYQKQQCTCDCHPS